MPITPKTMKKILPLLIAFITYSGFSQVLTPITWSGIITDNSGNPLQNTNVNLKFSVFLDDIETYSEIQLQTTDEKGFVTANIGTGTTIVGNYDTTLLTTLNSKLKIEVDTGAGFVILQDGRIHAVPTAKVAENALNLKYGDNNVSVSGESILIDSSNEINFLLDNQHVGAIEELGLRLYSLAAPLGETQNAPVEVTPSGYLIRGTPETAQLKQINITGKIGENFEDDMSFDLTNGLRKNFGSSDPLVKITENINLPQGAIIKNLKVTFKDNSPDANANILVALGRLSNDVMPPSETLLNVFDSGTLTPSSEWQTYTSPVLDHTVNNNTHSYFILIGSNNWVPTHLSLYNINITYEE